MSTPILHQSCVQLDGVNALYRATFGGLVSTIQYLAPKMQSLLHSATHRGFTMLHGAAQQGLIEVVQLLINEYKLDPTARTKVYGQTCRHLANSSRASGGLSNACGKSACDRCVCMNLSGNGDKFVEYWQ